MLNVMIHRWLRVPYYLNVRHLHKPKKARATVLLIHGLGDTADMWVPVIERLPKDVSVVAVDLLGFGESPRPAWEAYNAKAQVRSLLTTCLRLRIQAPLVIVGHSLGSLVAVEFARKYPLLTKSLILCSPPIYKRLDESGRPAGIESVLRSLYTKAAADPATVLRLYNLGRATRMLPKSVTINEENVKILIASLQASIINQTTIDDILRVNVPVNILSGLFDPLVVRKNLVDISNKRDSVTLKDIRAGHTITGLYAKEVAAAIEAALKPA